MLNNYPYFYISLFLHFVTLRMHSFYARMKVRFFWCSLETLLFSVQQEKSSGTRVRSPSNLPSCFFNHSLARKLRLVCLVAVSSIRVAWCSKQSVSSVQLFLWQGMTLIVQCEPLSSEHQVMLTLTNLTRQDR